MNEQSAKDAKANNQARAGSRERLHSEEAKTWMVRQGNVPASNCKQYWSPTSTGSARVRKEDSTG